MVDRKPLDQSVRSQVADYMRQHLLDTGLSRVAFAQNARVGVEVINKLCSGQFSVATLLRIEQCTGVRFPAIPRPALSARDTFGGYARTDIESYIGNYVMIRPDATGDPIVYAFAVRMLWDDNEVALRLEKVRDAHGNGYSLGHVHKPREHRHLFVLFNDNGLLSTTLLSPLAEGRMRGATLGMLQPHAGTFGPTVTPISLIRADTIAADATGVIERGHPRFAAYAGELVTHEQLKFVRSIDTAVLAAALAAPPEDASGNEPAKFGQAPKMTAKARKTAIQ